MELGCVGPLLPLEEQEPRLDNDTGLDTSFSLLDSLFVCGTYLKKYINTLRKSVLDFKKKMFLFNKQTIGLFQ